jgi:hypothetical protein
LLCAITTFSPSRYSVLPSTGTQCYFVPVLSNTE